MWGALRKYIIAGLLVWLPLAATVMIIKLVVDLLDNSILLLPPEYRPETLLGFSIPGLGVILALSILFLTGVLAANLLGRKLFIIWEALLGRIPLVRNIYNAVKQIASTVLASDTKAFRKVVLVEYPRTGVWSIGFLSNDRVAMDVADLPPDMAAVFIPTTPNPTSGFIILRPVTDIVELDMSVEDGFKFVISMGVVVPDGPLRAATGKLADPAVAP